MNFKLLLVTFTMVLSSVVALCAEPGAAEVARAREQILRLRREIARHDELYHREAAPTISDFEFDQLRRQLAWLEREFPDVANRLPPLAEIGDDRSGLFRTHRHRERMMSLDKVYAEADLRAFVSRVGKGLGHPPAAFVVEPKYDGLAVSVTFENGKLVRAVTRGNGTEGDDVTENVLRIPTLPRELQGPGAKPDLIELRGEVYVPFGEFARVNAEREAAGNARFANPRNLAAGTLRQLDAQEVTRRGLRIVFFGLGACEPAGAAPASQRALHAAIASWGLPGIQNIWTAASADEVVAAVEALRQARSDFDFPTDGAVVKVDAVSAQRALGAGDYAPRWAIAYKFPPERVETQLLAITLQVGRTGVLTPVAELAPVTIAGSTIARATLHNREEIARNDIRVGDFVYVEKAGEIIPAIVGVNRARRPATAQPFVFPTDCPECRGPVAQRPGEAAMRCSNSGCVAQLRRRLEHFASKDCLAIEGLGPAMIDALVAKGWVRDLPDLYRLKPADLVTLGRNPVSADRLIAAIERSKRAELWRVIHGLGLPKIGVAGAKELALKCGSLETLAAADSGPRALIDALVAVGLEPTTPGGASGRLAGKTFVLTGALPTLSRAQATARIEAAGGKVASSVSRNTHYVVAGTDAGAKLEQAKKFGIPQLDETALLRLLADEAGN